jgi:nitroreductase
MDLYEAIRTRFSCRSYADKPVEEDKLHRILEAARLAPSACNGQPWKFVVIRDAGRRQALAEIANNQQFIAQAGVVIAIVGTNPGRIMSCQVPSDPVDCAIAIEHLALAATAEGLATCWIGAFDQDRCKAFLGVPDEYKIVELLPMGYPAGEATPRDRKSLDEVVCYEVFE